MYGGVIQKLETGDVTHFGVEDNIYTMSLWIPPSHEGVFTGRDEQTFSAET